MKKLLSVCLALVLVLSLICSMSVSADELYQKQWVMEYQTGSSVAYLNLYGSSLNTNGFNTSDITYEKTGANTKGIDGTGGYSIKMNSYQVKGPGLIIDDVNNPIRGGYTYFKSAMVRLETSGIDPAKSPSTSKNYWTFTDIGGKGFACSAENFAAKLTSYDSATDKIAGYDWFGEASSAVTGTITTEWQRITNCVYRDASDANNTNNRERFGWGFVGTNWNTGWTGNWELIIDDYFILEAPNNALKSVSKPIVYGVSTGVTTGVDVGETLTGSYAGAYDVNPLLTPVVTGKWMVLGSSGWEDLTTDASYVVQAADIGKTFKYVVTATSTPKDASDADLAPVSYTAEKQVAVNPGVGRVVHAFDMDKNGNIPAGLCSSSLNTSGNPIDNSNIVYDGTGNTKGIDGTNGNAIEMNSYQTKAIGALMFDYNINNNTRPYKAGYSYFRSILMRLNEENCDDKAKAYGREIASFTDGGSGKGFVSTADNFDTKLKAYDGTSVIPNYDWNSTMDGTIIDSITTNWKRYTYCEYRDGADSTNNVARQRYGYKILFNTLTNSAWNTQYWTGNWEVVIDDAIMIEVPNGALKSAAYPSLYGAKLDKTTAQDVGATLTASYTEAYDVNPYLTPVVTYQWQSSADGSAWSDISGATASTYQLTANEAGKQVKAVITATSTPKDYKDADLTPVACAKSTASIAVNNPSYNLTANAFENATVTIDGNAVSASSVTPLEEGSHTIKVVADSGYMVTSVKIGGTEYPLNASDEATFAISAAANLEITTAESSSAVTTTVTPIAGTYEVGGKNYTTNAVYSKFTGITPIWYGMILQDVNNAANKLELKGEANVNGAFCIKVFGEALDGTYKMIPLVKTATEEIKGKESNTFTVSKPE